MTTAATEAETEPVTAVETDDLADIIDPMTADDYDDDDYYDH